MLSDLEHKIEDLDIGEYTFVATYSGNNYFTVSNSTTFSVSDYPNSQWVNESFDTSNSGKSIYDSESLPWSNHHFWIFGGVLRDECSARLSGFFQRRREEKRLFKHAER